MPNSNLDSIEYLKGLAIEFRDERDWQQFHSLKNLAASLSVESSELLEHFLWSEEARRLEEVEEEVSDILYNLLIFCHEANIDVGEAFVKKLEKNRQKYPISKSKGSSKKYSELDSLT